MYTHTQYRVNHPSLQFSSIAQPCPTTCDPKDCSMPGIPVHYQLPDFTQTHVYGHEMVMPSNHLIFCCPLLLPPPILPSIRVFSNVSSSPQVAKVLELQLQHQSFQWTLWLISFRMDWLDLLAVWGTLKSLLQHHSSKASILRCSTFFIVQLSYLYMTTGKPYIWLDEPLSAKWYLCLLIYYLSLS